MSNKANNSILGKRQQQYTDKQSPPKKKQKKSDSVSFVKWQIFSGDNEWKISVFKGTPLDDIKQNIADITRIEKFVCLDDEGDRMVLSSFLPNNTKIFIQDKSHNVTDKNHQSVDNDKSIFIEKEEKEKEETFINLNESKIILTNKEKKILTSYLKKIFVDNNNNKTLSAKLLYEGKRDGLNAKSWHTKCDNHINTITIIQTNYDHIFACFASIAWTVNLGYKIDKKSFLCLIRSSFENAKCPKFCPYKTNRKSVNGNNTYYGLYGASSYGPCFGSGFDVGIFAGGSNYNYCNLDSYTSYPDAFGNELCGGDILDVTNANCDEHHFIIKHIETYQIEIK